MCAVHTSEQANEKAGTKRQSKSKQATDHIPGGSGGGASVLPFFASLPASFAGGLPFSGFFPFSAASAAAASCAFFSSSSVNANVMMRRTECLNRHAKWLLQSMCLDQHTQHSIVARTHKQRATHTHSHTATQHTPGVGSMTGGGGGIGTSAPSNSRSSNVVVGRL